MKKKATAKLGEGIYTAIDASRIFHIPYSKANYWFGYYLRQNHFKTKYRYYFPVRNILAVNFLSLIEMYIFYRFKEKGISTREIIKAHESFSKLLETPYPFAARDFYVHGKEIWAGNKNEIITRKLQLAMPDIVIPLSDKISFRDDDGRVHKYYPLGKNKTIVVNPENQFGQPRIKGTNILAATVYNYYLGGDGEKFIAEIFDISVENVKDAIEFCRYSQAA